MSVRSSLRDLVVECGGTPTAKTVKGLLGEIAVALGGSGNGKNIAEQISNIVSAKNPLSVFAADVDITDSLLGKSVSDLQEDIEIGDGVITGTLKYVTGYTGFSGNPEEQSGHYLALHVGVPDVTGVTIKSKTPSMEITLDADGLIVIRIREVTTSVEFTATKSGHVPVKLAFDLTKLTLADPEEEPEEDESVET